MALMLTHAEKRKLIETRADVERLAAAGVDAVLVGESLVRADDARAAVAALAGVPRRPRGGGV